MQDSTPVKKPSIGAFRSPLKTPKDPQLVELTNRKKYLDGVVDTYQRIVRNKRAMQVFHKDKSTTLEQLIVKWRQVCQDATEHLRNQMDPVVFYAAMNNGGDGQYNTRTTISLRDMLLSLGVMDATVLLRYNAEDDCFM
jgi:hypothetical protein